MVLFLLDTLNMIANQRIIEKQSCFLHRQWSVTEDVSPVHLQNMGISIPKSESLWNFQDKQFVPWINTRNWGYFVLSQLVNSVLLGIKNCYLLWFSYLLLQSLPVFVHQLLRCILCSDLVWKIWGSNSGLQMYLGTYMTALSHPRLKLHFSHH